MSISIDEGVAALPEPLRATTAELWNDCVVPLRAAGGSPALAALPRVLACSRYVAERLRCRPEDIEDLLASGDIDRPYESGDCAAKLSAACANLQDDRELATMLRKIRHREMVRIAWRDIGGLADLETTTRETSWLADAVLETALGWQFSLERSVHGTPSDEQGAPQRLFVIAMGKLGGGELNFSSDVDLIFGYPRGGETTGSVRTLSNQEFFDRLGRRLIRVLNEPDEDGLVFRVDMRLRPFGDAGALTQSVPSMESYYAEHGRDWERYAMIKARICAGHREAGESLLRTLQPFVYRRYLDFGALQALREMKALIDAEVERAELHDDIKRGPGGIREIEFIAQTFQLVRGGREPQLRVRSTCAALQALRTLGELPASAVDELLSAYVFLRNTEHRIQQIDDRQTQLLPQSDEDRARVALGMGYDDWQQFEAELAVHRGKVQMHFSRLLEQRKAVPSRATVSPVVSQLAELWAGRLPGEASIAALRTAGFKNAEAALAEVDKLRPVSDIGRLSRHGQERMQRLMPMVLQTVAGHPDEIVALQRIFRLLEAVARRSVYLSLLAEQPQALHHLTELVAVSPWIANCIVQQPILLDELLDARALYAPPGASELEQALRAEIAKHDPQDLERHMESLRHFRQAEVLRVAASDLTGHLPLPEVSNHLSWIAEAVIRCALDLAWDYLITRHGRPHCTVDGQRRPAGFAVIAYGKLGGLELGYGSDLDLVFLHDSAGEAQVTDGELSVDNSTFFTRLAQRLIHLLSTLTPAGVAYEVDTRLRPSGASGLLVSSVNAYAKYQREQAWTWEHQALVRARCVGGDAAVGQAFDAIRAELLCRRRDRAALRREILEMRDRMRSEHATTTPGLFDLKQDAGGITDIEFMVQYGVLAYAAEYPDLLRWTDNKRLLQVFSACGVLPASVCAELCDAYFTLRARIHRCALQELPARVADSEFQEQRRLVTKLWREFLLQGG